MLVWQMKQAIDYRNVRYSDSRFSIWNIINPSRQYSHTLHALINHEVPEYTLCLAYVIASTRSNVGGQKTITTQADGASSVYAADIDGDGDMDVLSAS